MSRIPIMCRCGCWKRRSVCRNDPIIARSVASRTRPAYRSRHWKRSCNMRSSTHGRLIRPLRRPPRTRAHAASRTADDLRPAGVVRHHDRCRCWLAVSQIAHIDRDGIAGRSGRAVILADRSAGTAGAVIGDQIGYAAGRFGGRPLLNAVTKRIGGADKVDKAEAFSRKWAGFGIFPSRWLIGPLGPWINVTSRLSEYRGCASSR